MLSLSLWAISLPLDCRLFTHSHSRVSLRLRFGYLNSLTPSPSTPICHILQSFFNFICDIWDIVIGFVLGAYQAVVLTCRRAGVLRRSRIIRAPLTSVKGQFDTNFDRAIRIAAKPGFRPSYLHRTATQLQQPSHPPLRLHRPAVSLCPCNRASPPSAVLRPAVPAR